MKYRRPTKLMNGVDARKVLGANYSIPVDELLKKLYRILSDYELPKSVRDAAQREHAKLLLSKRT